MRLVACRSCRAQYDVTRYPKSEFTCRCSERVEIPPAKAVHVRMNRCSGCGGSLEPRAEICPYCRAHVERDHRKLSLVCPGCLTANRAGARFCCGCGESFRPEEVEAEATGQHCPDCGAELLRRRIVGHAACECPACRGLWLDRAAFDGLVERAADRHFQEALARSSRSEEGGVAPAPLRREGTPAVRYRKCVECGTLMNRKRFDRISDVVVDECVLHGVWLDEHELGAIARWVARNAGNLERDLPSTWDGGAPNPFPTDLPAAVCNALGLDEIAFVTDTVVVQHADGTVEKRKQIRFADPEVEAALRDVLEQRRRKG